MADAPGQDPAGEDARIASLEERIARAEQAEKVRQGATEQAADDGTRLGNRVLAELIGGLVGGALIGWVLDRLLGTSPWLLLVFLGLGIVAAFRNIIRLTTVKRPDEQGPPSP
ncbi:MAG: AtpZ/AtpI family protein [Pseudomonadota bacterium]|uniref:AtpZ/AtpI family protein n=1 Tax=Sphingobium sp. TaxID=1912891 RepID=UPI002E22166B